MSIKTGVTIGFNIAALDRVLGDAPIADVFKALSGYYARLAEQVSEIPNEPTVSQDLATRYPLAECETARDGCRAVVSLLSERDAANEAESERLCALLKASIALRGAA